MTEKGKRCDIIKETHIVSQSIHVLEIEQITTMLTPPTFILNQYSRLIHRFLIKILIYVYTTNKTY